MRNNQKIKSIISVVLCAMLVSSTLAACNYVDINVKNSSDADVGEADTIDDSAADSVIYGNIITMDEENPVAEAVTFKDGVITFVGSKEDADNYTDEATKVLDYGYNYVYPGFVDGHSHIALFAMLEAGGLHLSYIDTLRDNAVMMKKYIEENPGKEVYKGFGFWELPGDPDKVTHEVLDKYASDEVPIVWADAGAHSALLNQKAIEYFHVKDWVDIYGTEGVKVDENGEPTGYLVETPHFDLIEMIPVSKDEIKDFIQAKQEIFIAQGYTAMTDAAVVETENLPIYTAYKELAEEGKLKIKVRALFEISEANTEPLKEVERIAALSKEYDNEYFKITGVKVFIDGVPEGLTSWTKDPYTVEAGKGDNYYGYIRWDDSKKDNLTSIVKTANENGLLVQMHVMGEAAVSYAIDCFENARVDMPDEDYRNGLAHVSFIEQEDFKRMKDNKLTAFLAPQWSSWKPGTMENEMLVYGEEKAAQMYKIKSFMDEGVFTSFHTDGMCDGGVPEMIFSAVTRQNLQIASILQYDSFFPEFDEIVSDEIRGEDEIVSAQTALENLTINPAYTMKEEDNLGCIKVGMSADFSVYDTDFSDDEVAADYSCTQAKLLSAISSGRLIYPFAN